MAISWNAHGSVEICLLEHLCLDEFARDDNMTRFRTVYLRSGRLRRYEICTDNRKRADDREDAKSAGGDLHWIFLPGPADNFFR